VDQNPYSSVPSGDSTALRERVRSLRLPPEQDGNGTASRRIAWTLCLVFFASTVALAARQFRNSADASSEPKSAEKSAEEIAQAKIAPGSPVLSSKGYVVPIHQVLVSPQVSGRILKSNILEGRRVEKDEILAELEDTDYRADRDRAKALLEMARQRRDESKKYRDEEIDQAQAELEESKAQLAQLESFYKRAAELVRTNVLSESDFEEAQSRRLAMQQRVRRLQNALSLMKEGPRIERQKAAEAEVRQVEAELAKAEWRLNNCIIRAPISGTILKKNAEEGNIVNPIAFNGSFSLCDLADLAQLEIDLTIQERDIARVAVGQRCTVRAEAFQDHEYQGVVSRIMPIADRAKGAVPVRVKVSVPRHEEGVYLKPEMGALVSFFADEKPADNSAEKPAAKAAAQPAENPAAKAGAQ
jgi:multidrug resistance efflux pump